MKSIDDLRNYRPQKIPLTDSTQGIRRPVHDVGEFLLPIEASEIEIARINLASTTGDAYSIRIKKNEEKNYVVSVQDEYETEFSGFNSEYKKIPTQGELFDLLMEMHDDDDSLPHLMNIVDFHEFKTVKEVRYFIQFDSNLYPDLNEIFQEYLIRNGFNL